MGEFPRQSTRKREAGDYVPVRGEQIARLFSEVELIACGIEGENMVWRFRGGLVLRQHAILGLDHLALSVEETPDA